MRRSDAHRFLPAIAIAVAVALLPASVFAQSSTLTPQMIAGKYNGSATSPSGDIALKADLKIEKDAIAGSIETDQGPVVISGSAIKGDQVLLNIEMNGEPGTMVGSFKDGRLQGTWTLGEESGTYTLTKTAEETPKPAAPPAEGKAPAAPAKTTSAADPISGTWDGVTGSGEMTRNFTLTLKLDGEKLTGDISSEEGGAPFNSATWKDGTLTVAFDYGGMGTITMVGALKEGKLVGTLDVGGQMQMPWGAVKRQ